MSHFSLAVFWILVYSAAMTVLISDLVYGFFGMSEGSTLIVWALCFLSGIVLSETVIKDDEQDDHL